MNDLRNVFGEGAHWIQNQCFLCWRHAVHENKRKPTTEQTGRKAANEPVEDGVAGGVAGPEGGWLDGRKGAGRMLLLWQWQQGATRAADAPIDKSCRAIWAVEHLSWRRQNTNANACRSTRSCICICICISLRVSVWAYFYICVRVCEEQTTTLCGALKSNKWATR